MTVHAREQDNDADGYIKFFDYKDKAYCEEYINKGQTKTYDISGASRVHFHSRNRNSWYNANLVGLNYWNDNNKDQLASIYVNVNFYKKEGYYDNFNIDKIVRGSTSGKDRGSFAYMYTKVNYNKNGIFYGSAWPEAI